MSEFSVKHPSEDDLILHFYGEAPNAPAVDDHLSRCFGCAHEFERLRATLTAIDFPIPERVADYEAQLWSTLRPRLSKSVEGKPAGWVAWFNPQRWAVAGAVAVIVIAAFLAGRLTRPEKPGVTAPQLVNSQPSLGGPDRVLMVAVGDHLDRTQMVLVELVNARAEGKLDISTQRDMAQNLVEENRLYRQTAQHDKDSQIAGALDQIERVLIDIAHQPDSVSARQLEELQHRIESQGVLFKVRVVESTVKARTRPEPQKAPSSSANSRS
jgi:hypothetical protein